LNRLLEYSKNQGIENKLAIEHKSMLAVEQTILANNSSILQLSSMNPEPSFSNIDQNITKQHDVSNI
jgi:hypothetical protein